MLPTWVKTNLEGEAGSPGRREWALTRRCDPAGCTGCGSPGFTQRCFLGGRYLPRPSVPIRLAASRCSCRLGRGEGLCVAVTSSSGGGVMHGHLCPVPPADATGAAVPQPALLSVALPVSSVLMATFEISCC